MAADPEMPDFTNWQEAWEWHARQTSDAFAELSEDELLQLAQEGRYDGYYTLWDNLAAKASLAKAAPVLLDVLRREAGETMMLVRYHCAAALFRLMGYPREPAPPLRVRVQWDHAGEPARQEALDELEQRIAEQLAHEASPL
jgi:hypothetical protein